MSNQIFIGRKKELERLQGAYLKKTPQLIVIKGRRRVGKSRLVSECAKQLKNNFFWNFSGLAPQEGVTAQDQRNHFAKQLSLMLKIPFITFEDWTDAFEFLTLHVRSGDIILFDEISWMGLKDPTFIPKLKVWWDKQTTHMLLVFCSSVSIWIEENILQSTAFFGRINLVLQLNPLTIAESRQFLVALKMKLSDYDLYKILSILGGIPWYLEQCNPQMTADENIKQLAFENHGLLVTEFDRIFHDLFNGKGTSYKKILEVLKEGAKTLAEIREALDFAQSGTLSKMMEQLVIAGFIEKQPLWSFKTAKPLKQSLYRISDPYIRFYLKMIEPYLPQIKAGTFDQIPLSTMVGFDTHMGLQLEVLLLQNRALIQEKLGISPVDVVQSGPYRQIKNSTQQGCQIDYLIQTKTNNLFVCEFKFKRREVGNEIIAEMQTKLAALKAPKGFAPIPVLFHLSGVTEAVDISGYFYRVIDITDFLS